MKYILKLLRAIKISTYIFFYYKKNINSNYILIESENGKGLADNMFYVLNELAKSDYGNYKINIAVLNRNINQVKDKLETNSLGNNKRIAITRSGSFKYYYCLASSKFLFTDTSFPKIYIKKDGQIIVNTWHGTPLKKMGKDVGRRAYSLGNIQRNLFMSDYFVCPSVYKKDIMFNAYMLENLFQGRVLYEGYPRNSVLFGLENGSEIKRKLGLSDKKIFLYMPTYRGVFTENKAEELVAKTEYYLDRLENNLKDDQVLFVKMHTYVNNAIDYNKYSRIKPYPEKYNVYMFMNICEVMITDYSSVMFDFANTKKKIILFTYDEKQYIKDRGLYINLEKLPFPKVETIDDLVYELNMPKKYDDSVFIKKYCTFDSPGALKRLCTHVIKGEKVCREITSNYNNKDNVIIYNSNLAINGITKSMTNLFNNIDLSKRNYFITFNDKDIRRVPSRLRIIPKEVGIIPMDRLAYMTFFEKIAYRLYYNYNFNNKFVRKILDIHYKRELKRKFPCIDIKYVVHYSGYNRETINLFQRCEAKKIIFVHSNMVEELKSKNNQHFHTLKHAYQTYDKVAVVSEQLLKPTYSIGLRKDNLFVVNNCHAYHEVIDNSKKPVEFNDRVLSNISLNELKTLLDSNLVKFINIGRFSKEKGHYMLIQAYEKFILEYPNSCLIIIGGYGPLYKDVTELANSSNAKIVVIKSLDNPMPILKKSDLFILSSMYEGLGLVIMEADILGVPIISTDIPGPREFLKKYNGCCVDTSVDGLFKGMMDFIQGKINTLNVDYDELNNIAVEQFENLFDVKENHNDLELFKTCK